MIHLSIAATCLFATGCVEPAEDSAGIADSTATSSTSLTTNDYSWYQGQGPIRMLHQSAGFCFLTRVSGKFEGGGESVRIGLDGSGYFTLFGTSYQEGVTANARCVTWNEFGATGGRVDTFGWTSSNSTVANRDNASFCYLSAISGQFDFGGGEWVGVSTGGTWSTTARALSGAGTHAQTTCVTMHDAANRTIYPKLGPQTWAFQPGSVWTCTVDNGTAAYCARSIAMTSSRGVCMLSHVGGALRGGGEFAQIDYNGFTWSLSVRSMDNRGGVHAYAQCLYF